MRHKPPSQAIYRFISLNQKMKQKFREIEII